MKRILAICLIATMGAMVMSCLGDPLDGFSTRHFYLGADEKEVFPSSHAEMYFMAATDVVVAVPGTYYLVDGTATIYESEDFVTNSTLPRLTYIGPDTKHFQIMASISIHSDKVNVVTTWYFYVNGIPHPSAAATTLIATPGDVGAIGLINLERLSTNDYIEVYVTGNKACTLTIENMTVDIVGVN